LASEDSLFAVPGDSRAGDTLTQLENDDDAETDSATSSEKVEDGRGPAIDVVEGPRTWRQGVRPA